MKNPSNKILRNFLEMWAFTLKITEKTLVKKKVILKASYPLKELFRSNILGVARRTFNGEEKRKWTKHE